MKKKVISVLLAGMVICAMTACGGNDTTKENVNVEEEGTDVIVAEYNQEEDGEVEVSEEVQKALEDAQKESAEESSSGIVKTVQGEFNGYFDDNSIAVMVNGNEEEYALGNQEVREKVSNFAEGDSIMFEAEVDTNKIIKIVEAGITEPPQVSLSEEEAAAGIEVGQLVGFASENIMKVKIGDEQFEYGLSDEAMQDIYNVKVNYGYDVKFQTEGEGENKKIVKFIY
ncbi:MAG: hypothetical protein K2M46_11350 [Lachnospiraceae bacterium]|nr:hypothetical protein [Lachnospiraceae bacterium]